MRDGVVLRGDRSLGGPRLAGGALERRAPEPAGRRGRATARPRLAHLGERGTLPQPGRGADRARGPARCRGPHHLRQSRLRRPARHHAGGAAGHHPGGGGGGIGRDAPAGGRGPPGRPGDRARRRRLPALVRLRRDRDHRARRPARGAAGGPRRHRAGRVRPLPGGGPQPGRGGQRGEIPLPRQRQPRVSHAAQRHHGHGRPDARNTPEPRATHLCRGGEDLRRGAPLAHRRHSRFLEDRGRPPRPRGGAVRPCGPGRERGRVAGTSCPGQGPRDRRRHRGSCRRPWSAMPTGCGRS